MDKQLLRFRGALFLHLQGSSRRACVTFSGATVTFGRYADLETVVGTLCALNCRAIFIITDQQYQLALG
jgi:hypothetical protein